LKLRPHQEKQQHFNNQAVTLHRVAAFCFARRPLAALWLARVGHG
jgi:hypothetical protein